jgi:geranylgeranyl pyrophosphate synthase
MIRQTASPNLHESFSRVLVLNNPGALGTEPNLQSALEESVSNPGGLVRAGLILSAAAAHGLAASKAEQLACALEYWHQASLILDDLPCMDDAERRRGLRCLHRTHGEATAILAALALINRAYSLVQRAFDAESAEVRQTSGNLVDQALGSAGVLGGQAWDLRFGDGTRAPREVGRIAWRKTGALVWLAVSLPLLPSGAWQEERRSLRALSVYWALAYQGMDDLSDLTAVGSTSGKTTGRDAVLQRPSLPIALGEANACRRIERLLALAEVLLLALGSRDLKWTYLADWHARLFTSRYRLLIAA